MYDCTLMRFFCAFFIYGYGHPNYRPLQRDKGDCSHIKASGTDAEPDWRA